MPELSRRASYVAMVANMPHLAVIGYEYEALIRYKPGHDVGPRSMMIECTMTCAKDVHRGVTRESQSMGGDASMRCELRYDRTKMLK